MRNQSGCMKLGAILFLLASIIAVLAGSAFIYFDYSSRQKTRVRGQYAPPTVQVTNPASGISVAEGSFLGVSATATGMRRIVSAELWLDGELRETQKSEGPEGISPFYADFSLLMPSEGAHALFVRAVDTTGLIGQSQSVSIMSEPKPTEVFLVVQLQEGETLDGIATANGITPEILHELNQGLGNPPPVGSVVKVPTPPEEQSETVPAAPLPIPGTTPVEIPNIPMLQIASVKSPGLLPSGPFLPEPFAGKVGPPIAPTGLQAELKGCKVMLRWNDNADQEDNYYVYMVPVTFHGFAVPIAYLKPSPSTGLAWYEFQPTVGGAVSLWVEAANSYGAQPSNVAWVYIPSVSECPPTVADDLDVSLLDITVGGNYDKTYCYVSFENHPEQRIPYQEDNFIQLQGGKNQSPISQGFTNYFTVPVPKDGSLDVSGKCLGWAGDALKELGSFNAALPPDTWNGDRQTLQGSAYQIGISVKPRLTATNIGRDIVSTDPTLLAPYDVHEEPLSKYPWLQSTYPPSRILQWKWDGDPKNIDDYEIFLNGQPYGSHLSLDKEEVIYLPGECDRQVRWQVAVRSGTTISNLSTPLEYDLPPCQRYLRVSFDSILLENTDDGFPTKGAPCETLDAYFQISVRDVTRSFWGNNFFLPLKCGRHYFGDMTGGPYKQLYGAVPYVITIPLAPDEDISMIWIRTRFMDHDDNPDDPFGIHNEHPGIYLNVGEKWDKCYETRTTGASITDEARSTLTFTLAVYPNTCRDIPPPEGL